jgi:GT2 family glycosyltransferase
MKLFLLGYNAVDYLNSWFKTTNYTNTDFYFIDNGQQNLPSEIKDILSFTTTRNIGCAGGWNLICDIAFNHMGLEKVIIGEEDAIFNQEMIESLWNYCEPDRMMTTYGNGFGYALFCIHKETFEKVGRFDENIMYAAWEDADHKVRCAKQGVEVFCMEVDPSLNGNSTAHDPNSPRNDIHEHNKQYFILKWGADFHIDSTYYDEPFKGNPIFTFDPVLEEHYGKLTEFPSQTEYKLYKKTND